MASLIALLTPLLMITKSPMIMAMTIALQSLVLAYAVYTDTGLSWSAYTLIMMFLSGMMVLFVYIAALASNMFSQPKLMNWLILTISSYTALIAIPPKSKSPELTNEMTTEFKNQIHTQLYMQFEQPYAQITMLLIILLLLALMATALITNYNKTPLRSL